MTYNRGNDIQTTELQDSRDCIIIVDGKTEHIATKECPKF